MVARALQTDKCTMLAPNMPSLGTCNCHGMWPASPPPTAWKALNDLGYKLFQDTRPSPVLLVRCLLGCLLLNSGAGQLFSVAKG